RRQGLCVLPLATLRGGDGSAHGVSRGGRRPPDKCPEVIALDEEVAAREALIRVGKDSGKGLGDPERGQQSHVVRGGKVSVDNGGTGDGRDFGGELSHRERDIPAKLVGLARLVLTKQNSDSSLSEVATRGSVNPTVATAAHQHTLRERSLDLVGPVLEV